jgi:hypothetical protein
MLFAFIGFADAAPAPQPHFRVTGIYSNLHYNDEGGDLLGMELLIIPDNSSYVACVQIAEGGSPFVVVVPFVVKGSQVQFTLPSGSAYSGTHFTGSFASGGAKLILQWPQGPQEVLVRGRSYWQ